MTVFDQRWELFEQWYPKAGGALLRIEPLRPYFSKEYARGLTREVASKTLFEELARWGKIESESDPEVMGEESFYMLDGFLLSRISKWDDDHTWAHALMFRAFVNLTCLAAYKKTIEELVLESYSARDTYYSSEASLKSIKKLIGFSKSFLLADWFQELVFKAISNKDKKFFKAVGAALKIEAGEERYASGRQWLGTSLLWYLGGKDIQPRGLFLELLKEKKIIAESFDEPVFRGMLQHMRLTKRRV